MPRKKQQLNPILTALLVSVGVIGGLLIALFSVPSSVTVVEAPPPPVGGLFSITGFQGVATTGVAEIGSSITLPNDNFSYRLLATNTDRYYASICNTGGETVFLSMASDTDAIAFGGIALNGMASSSAPGPTCYEFVNNVNLYIGSIKAITDKGTTTIGVTEVALPVR